MCRFRGEEGALEVKAVAVLAQGGLVGILNRENSHHLSQMGANADPPASHVLPTCAASLATAGITCSLAQTCSCLATIGTGVFAFLHLLLPRRLSSGCQHVTFPAHHVSILQLHRGACYRAGAVQGEGGTTTEQRGSWQKPAMGTCNRLCISRKKC